MVSLSKAFADELVGSRPERLEEFAELAAPIIDYILGNLSKRIPSKTIAASHYHLLRIKANDSMRIRPINTRLFIEDSQELRSQSQTCFKLLDELARNRGNTAQRATRFESFIRDNGIDKVFYTIQQGIGCGLDIFVPENQARKLAGIYFEMLMKAVFERLGMHYKSLQLSIPLESQTFRYKCDIDCVINRVREVSSTSTYIDTQDTIVSIKTSSKDRMPKIFIDKLLLERFVGHKIKLVAIFHNDIQRQAEEKVSVTFVANLFLIYTKFLSELDGVYFVDPPIHVEKEPWKDKVLPFSRLVLEDIWKI